MNYPFRKGTTANFIYEACKDAGTTGILVSDMASLLKERVEAGEFKCDNISGRSSTILRNLKNKKLAISIGQRYIFNNSTSTSTYVDKKDSKRICIIMPTYKRLDMIDVTLDRIFQSCIHSGLKWSLVIVDDASGEFDKIKIKIAEFDQNIFLINHGLEGIFLLNHTENKGVGAARRTGTEYALGLKPDFVLSIDDDTRLSKTAISVAVDFLEEKTDCGAVGRDAPLFAMNKPIFYEKDNLPGCFMMIRAEVFEDTGNWDDSFRQREDLDLSIRIIDRGWKIFANSNIKFSSRRGNPGGLNANGESDINLANPQILNKYPGRFSEMSNGNLKRL